METKEEQFTSAVPATEQDIFDFVLNEKKSLENL